MKNTARSLVVLALVACSFTSAAVVKKNLAQESCVNCAMAGGPGQGEITAKAAGAVAEVDLTEQHLNDIICESHWEHTSSAQACEEGSGHGCEVGRRLYKWNGALDYDSASTTVEEGTESGDFHFTSDQECTCVTRLVEVVPVEAPNAHAEACICPPVAGGNGAAHA